MQIYFTPAKALTAVDLQIGMATVSFSFLIFVSWAFWNYEPVQL